MTEWVTEEIHHTRLGFETRQRLFSQQSDFQLVEIIDTVAYGKMLLLDGAVMTTEKDEFVYHEMISHVPLLSHPNPKDVLVIGGGDGGTVREVVKHPDVETVTLCEIDAVVIEACRQYLPTIAGQLDHPKVKLAVGDGVAYLANMPDQSYDVIMIDSTDPVGPGEGLFTKAFYQDVFRTLKADGIMVAQSESPFANQDLLQKIFRYYGDLFPIVRMYTGHIPTYPTGFWSWAFCSKQHSPALSVPRLEQAKAISKDCRYYNSEIHLAAFVLPNFVKVLLPSAVLIP